jgi:hypothetical protein
VIATWQRRAAVLAVMLCAVPPAHADEGIDVTLEVAPCVRADSQRVRRLFELELGTSHAESAAAASGARVAIRCDGDLVVLTVYDPVTGKSLSRAIDPGPPAGRDRLIALAVLELLVASWVELEATPEPVGRPASDASSEAARSSARAIVRRRIPGPRWRTSVLAVGGTRLADELHHGGGLRLTRSSSAGWGYSVDLTGRRATAELEPGDVTISSLEVSLALLRYRRTGAVALLAGAGLRGALVSLDGASGRADVVAGEVTGFAGGPLARIGIELFPVADVTVGVTAEGGIHLLEVRGQVDGRDQTGARGVWAAANLEVGWTF